MKSLPACLLVVFASCATTRTPPTESTPLEPIPPSAPPVVTARAVIAAEPEATITLAAVGDTMLGSTYPYPDGRDLPPADDRPAGLMTPLAPLLQAADIAFGNLEGVIVDATNAAAKPKCNGFIKDCFAFRMPPALTPQLAAAGFDVMSMANNHVMDFGEAGRESTRAQLDALGIRYSGKRGDVARWVVKGRRVALVAMSNYAYAYNLNELADAKAVIANEAAHNDIVIVSFHGGGEGPDYLHVSQGPEFFIGQNRGDLRVFAHAAIDAGADLVIGHGPHVVRALEIYQGRLIAYSLGNFSTYKRFNLSGVNGLGCLLEVAIAAGDGRFVSGRVHALRQPGLGGPEVDPDAAVLPQIRSLSREDFPDTGVDLGPAGEIAPHAQPPAPPVPPGPPAPSAKADPPGLERLGGVHPHLRELAIELYRRATAAGVPLRIVFGYTPYTRRTRPGPGGMATWHQFGLAFDIVIADRKDIGDGRRHFADDAESWRTIGAIADAIGLVWGGAWRTTYDPFHLEWHPGDDSTISSSDLHRLLAHTGANARDYRAAWALYPD